ncbi:aminodeoxychorismate synthase component I [Agaribacterium haliotis]|uniref:aminodeoxychorismate synthase component I n=1 Tax=Agaribacterium haliotis TaxID=2013869 RepID=UPI000BB52F85|nr:aminodeoxychorismate synthase component I [Agaribacterium haliotis]
MPVVELDYHPDSEHHFEQLAPLANRVWLDGQQSRPGRWSIFSAEPLQVFVKAKIEQIKKAVEALKHEYSDALETLQQLPFCGGAIGFCNYEHRHQHFNLAVRPKNKQDSAWAIYDWAVVVDHQKKQCFFVSLPKLSNPRIQSVLSLLQRDTPNDSKGFFRCGKFIAQQCKSDYLRAFDRIQNYIQAGDCYQINYSQQFNAPFSGSGAAAYQHLRKQLGGPYSAYLELGEQQILSLSPEQFIHVNDRFAQSKPIKGTCRRGQNYDEDQNLARALLASEKNRAENLMIVDLLRNDFGQLCTPGSVHVPELFALESYANVHHLVSTVRGKLPGDINALDFFYSCFPGGSITGAPKKRAMQIIDELEPHTRNIYCGSVVSYSANNKLDSSIAIRSLLIKDKIIQCWGGGGIVADSGAEEEYAESLTKVRALMQALERGPAKNN